MKKIILSTAFLLAISLGAEAQLKDMMMKKAGEKLQKKTEKSETTPSSNTSTTTESTTPATTETTPATTTEQAPANPGFTFGGGGKKEIRPKYNFTQNVLFDMKSYDKKGNVEEKKSAKMRMHLSNEPYNGSEIYDDKGQSAGFSIFEADKEQSVMLMDNNGSKIAMVNKFSAEKMGEKAAEDQNKNNAKITKTGRKKTICNIVCEEYLMTDDKGSKIEMWVAPESGLTLSGAYTMFSAQNKKFAEKFGNSKDYPQGFMMQMINYETNGERFEMTAVEINKVAPKTIETAGYVIY